MYLFYCSWCPIGLGFEGRQMPANITKPPLSFIRRLIKLRNKKTCITTTCISRIEKRKSCLWNNYIKVIIYQTGILTCISTSDMILFLRLRLERTCRGSNTLLGSLSSMFSEMSRERREDEGLKVVEETLLMLFRENDRIVNAFGISSSSAERKRRNKGKIYIKKDNE